MPSKTTKTTLQNLTYIEKEDRRMKYTLYDDILINKINSIQQMDVIVDGHYTGEECDNNLKLVFTDNAGQTLDFSLSDPITNPERFRVDAILLMFMCCRIFSENGLPFPFWNVACSDWQHIRPMLRSVLNLLSLKSAGRITDFISPKENMLLPDYDLQHSKMKEGRDFIE